MFMAANIWLKRLQRFICMIRVENGLNLLLCFGKITLIIALLKKKLRKKRVNLNQCKV